SVKATITVSIAPCSMRSASSLRVSIPLASVMVASWIGAQSSRSGARDQRPRAILGARTLLRPWLSRQPSWLRIVVAVVVHGPQEHHGVILVHDVVAMQRIVAAEVAEAEEELDRLVESEPYHVLA